MEIKKVAIIGVGLIGGSLALALREKGICSDIQGSGRTEEKLLKAKEKGIINAYSLNHADVCREADVIVLATPVGCFKDILSEIKSSVKKGAIITDVGSVKGRLVKELEANISEESFFVGAHPIAGSERSGFLSSTSDLFEGALCMITPTDNTDLRSLEIIEIIWTEIGARVKKIPPDEHDRIFSTVSHMPHLAAYAIVNAVSDIEPSYIDYSGQGFKDTTRIAKSSPELWIDICKYNKDNIMEHLDILIDNLDRIKTMFRKDDYESLISYFGKAREFRKTVG